MVRFLNAEKKNAEIKFSVTVGTIYENTKIPLTKWFLATYIIAEKLDVDVKDFL
jgi:hypothetical protein